MSSFTEEQLAELEALYGLKRLGQYKVRDGFVNEGDTIWWRGEHGPEKVVVSVGNMHFSNMKRYPNVYSIKEPEFSLNYKD